MKKSMKLIWARNGVDNSWVQMLVGEPQRKRLLGRHKRRWEDNIKMDHKEIVLEGVDWIIVAQGR
jgi:hypothetical protein